MGPFENVLWICKVGYVHVTVEEDRKCNIICHTLLHISQQMNASYN